LPKTVYLCVHISAAGVFYRGVFWSESHQSTGNNCHQKQKGWENNRAWRYDFREIVAWLFSLWI